MSWVSTNTDERPREKEKSQDGDCLHGCTVNLGGFRNTHGDTAVVLGDDIESLPKELALCFRQQRRAAVDDQVDFISKSLLESL